MRKKKTTVQNKRAEEKNLLIKNLYFFVDKLNVIDFNTFIIFQAKPPPFPEYLPL